MKTLNDIRKQLQNPRLETWEREQLLQHIHYIQAEGIAQPKSRFSYAKDSLGPAAKGNSVKDPAARRRHKQRKQS